MATIIGNGSLPGTSSDDIIIAGSGDDELFGLEGNDLLVGDGSNLVAAGNDLLDGGDGYDNAAFVNGVNGVTVDLRNQGQAQNTGRGYDTLRNIEQVTGSQFSDVLIGNNADNILHGYTGGNDVLIGYGGNDLLIAAPGGANWIDGGEGVDWLASIFPAETVGGLTVNLSLSAQDTGQGVWTIVNIENVSGSIGNDVFIGTAGDNMLAGSAGSDFLDGGAGNDTLLGDGEANFGSAIGSGPATVYLEPTTGESGDDILYGRSGNDTLAGGAGNDQQYGGDGNDLLYGAPGDDLLDGGPGIDMASYFYSPGPVRVFLFISGQQNTGTSSGFDMLVGIEGLTGSEFNDALAGNNQANVLNGGAGDDGLEGREGNDVLNGGAGADGISGGTGSDRYVYQALADSSPLARDVIVDFSGRVVFGTNPGGRQSRVVGDGDKIDLSQIDANALVAGDQAFTFARFDGTAGQLYAERNSATNSTTIYMDVDGDAVADMQIVLLGNVLLSGADIIL